MTADRAEPVPRPQFVLPPEPVPRPEPAGGPATVIRPRADGDLSALVAVLRRVHEASGYPGRWPESPRQWIARPHSLAAWVAAGEAGELLGHVALHDAGQDRSAPRMAELAGLDLGEVDVVARLFVTPESQGAGVGRALLEAAARAARARGRVPVLDVLADSTGALAFYRSCGWRRCGEFEFAFNDGVFVTLVAYAGPPPPGRSCRDACARNVRP